jgi:hypothetical protein
MKIKNLHLKIYFKGPLMVLDPTTREYIIIGVTVDAPYTWEDYKQGPSATFSRITEVLPWIYDTMEKTTNG